MKTYTSSFGTLYNGDCLEIMPTLEKVDLVLTDPPYGTTACKWDSIIPFDKMWDLVNDISDNFTPIVLFGSEPFSSALRMSNIKKYKYDWIWEKSRGGGFLNANRQPLKRHEIISVFYEKQVQYYPQKTEGKPYKVTNGKVSDIIKDKTIGGWETVSDGKRFPISVINFESVKKTVHPTQKPVALMEYLIKTYTKQGETVLDFTMGSGTTCVAAVNTGRKFIGIEKDEKYFEIAVERVREAEQKILDGLEDI